MKEIKELFKNCDFTLKHCGNCVLWKDEDCIETIKSKVLTLINELESENERLKKTNCDDCAGCTQWKCDCANIKAYELEQFAERLKEKFYYEGRICRYIIDSDTFDETLKEFINNQEYENNTTNIRLETLKDFREKYKEALKEAVKGENVD